MAAAVCYRDKKNEDARKLLTVLAMRYQMASRWRRMRAPRAASCSRRSRTRTSAFNWNTATDSYKDLLDTGVIDPATVTMQAILSISVIA